MAANYATGMTPPRRPAGLSDIAADYDALLCDAWGVIHDGVRLFPGVEDALTRFRARRGPVIILTNAPRPASVIPPQLDRLGLARAAYDGVVTSGDATRAAIRKFAGAPLFKIGPEKDEKLYEGLSVEFAPLDRAGAIICTGLFDDERETPDDYRAMLTDAAARGLPMVCANPDIVVRWGDRLIYCAGALAALYASLGGDVIYGGKPYPPIYDLALQHAAHAAGNAVGRARILAIGDGVATDIAGANRNGLASLYIAGAGGVHEGAGDEASVVHALGAGGVTADFWMPGLVW